MDRLSQAPPNFLRLSAADLEKMRAHVEQQAPEEACGILAGQDAQALAIIPVTNALHSPVRFHMAPQEQLAAFQQMEQAGWELIGIYHSHPVGLDKPSETDLAEAYYPEALHLVWSRLGDEWICKAYQIYQSNIVEIQIVIESPSA